MSIEQNIRNVQREIQENPGRGNDLKKLAVEAIYAGFGSQAWADYMRQFAASPQELTRLTTKNTDGTSKYVGPARAYLVGNAVCLPGTNTNLLQGVENYLDETLQ